MCGFVGYWDKNGVDARLANKMALQIEHRGPDSAGVWVDENEQLVLAHRRLSIIDLSSAGQQPMQSTCGRYTLVFNGEIYNHKTLKSELNRNKCGWHWKGKSDTEVLLAFLSYFGIKKTLQKLNGMFAFAFWDNDKKKLFLARDRLGEKPLYYGYVNDTFFFGSQLKAFSPHPKWSPEIDTDSLNLYLQYNYIPSKYSIYKHVHKLSPAHYVEVSDFGQTCSLPERYWDINGSSSNYQNYDESSYVEQCHELLRDSVVSRMEADVSLGAFLSGGVDSSLVVALMQEQSEKTIKTFTVGFENSNYNEAEHALEVAKHLGTDHHELYISSDELLETVPKIASIWDEPFSDASQIPTFVVSQKARDHVKVVLSGDGGDELFCGYNRYTQGYDKWKQFNTLPAFIRRTIASLINVIPGNLYQYLSVSPNSNPLLHQHLKKFANVLQQDSQESYFSSLVCNSDSLRFSLNESDGASSLVNNYLEYFSETSNFRQKMMFVDSLSYLPDDILTKVDRSSMAVGLEARVPLLDHRLVEFASQIPMSLKYKQGTSKWIAREVLYKYVPSALIDRPKMGFSVPIEQWLKTSLREWAEDLFDKQLLRRQGYFDADKVQKQWSAFINGNNYNHQEIWNLLMFQEWLQTK